MSKTTYETFTQFVTDCQDAAFDILCRATFDYEVATDGDGVHEEADTLASRGGPIQTLAACDEWDRFGLAEALDRLQDMGGFGEIRSLDDLAAKVLYCYAEVVIRKKLEELWDEVTPKIVEAVREAVATDARAAAGALWCLGDAEYDRGIASAIYDAATDAMVHMRFDASGEVDHICLDLMDKDLIQYESAILQAFDHEGEGMWASLEELFSVLIREELDQLRSFRDAPALVAQDGDRYTFGNGRSFEIRNGEIVENGEVLCDYEDFWEGRLHACHLSPSPVAVLRCLMAYDDVTC